MLNEKFLFKFKLGIIGSGFFSSGFGWVGAGFFDSSIGFSGSDGCVSGAIDGYSI